MECGTVCKSVSPSMRNNIHQDSRTTERTATAEVDGECRDATAKQTAERVCSDTSTIWSIVVRIRLVSAEASTAHTNHCICQQQHYTLQNLAYRAVVTSVHVLKPCTFFLWSKYEGGRNMHTVYIGD